MARQLQAMKEDVDIGVRSDARGSVTDTEITSLFNTQLRLLKSRGDFRGTRISAPIDIYHKIYEYPLPSEYKSTKLLRPTEGYQEIDMLQSNEWRQRMATTNESIIANEQHANDKILLARVSVDDVSVTLDTLAEYDANGTATAIASTDTVNVRTADGSRYKSSSATAFDIDVSASGTNTAGIEKTLTTGIDLSAEEDIGMGFLDVFVPDGLTTYLTSVTLRWGSSSSNYWESSVTECFNGQAFSKGKNVLGFAWSSATETGTPDASDVDYFRILLTYSASQTDVSLVALQDLRFANPTEFIHEYYSTRFVKDADNTLKDEFDSADDVSLLEDYEDDMLVNGVISEIHFLKGNDNDAARAANRFEEYYSKITNSKPGEEQKPSQNYYEL